MSGPPPEYDMTKVERLVLHNTWTVCTGCLRLFPVQVRIMGDALRTARNQPQCPKCRSVER